MQLDFVRGDGMSLMSVSMPIFVTVFATVVDGSGSSRRRNITGYTLDMRKLRAQAVLEVPDKLFKLYIKGDAERSKFDNVDSALSPLTLADETLRDP